MTLFERRLALALEHMGPGTAPMPTRPGTRPGIEPDEPDLEPDWEPEPERQPQRAPDPFEPEWPDDLPFSEPKAKNRRGRPRL